MHHPENWNLDFATNSPRADQYNEMIESIQASLSFMEAVLGVSVVESKSIDFFTSHEGLHLSYEQAQTRQVPRRDGWYNMSTHLPWIGYRTRDLDGAHVEYFKGIENPVGIKVGPQFVPAELVELVKVLNPKNEPGRITLIHRFDDDKVAECLPPIVEAIQEAEQKVLFVSDPMHCLLYTSPSPRDRG